MVSEAPRRPLRDALAGLGATAREQPGESSPAPYIATGIVTSVQLALAPYTVRLALADGTETGDLPFLGWWTPTVNDLAWVAVQGPAMFVLGGVAPSGVVVNAHRHKAADIDGTVLPPAPTPGTPPPPPPPPPTVRTVGVAPVDMAYWGLGEWRRDGLIQGGPRGYRPHWFYGGGIAAARAGGTIVGGSIYVQRTSDSHGVGGAANVRLGVHGLASAASPGSSPLSWVSVQAALARGQAAQVPLSQAQIDALNNGALGLGLEPGGTSYTSPDYLKAVFGGASGQLSLTVQG